MRMKIFALLFLGIFGGIFLIGIASATTCCERTTSNAWCQTVDDASQCQGSPYESVSALCEATSYCKLGTCIIQNQGICMPNTPRRSCESSGGTWSTQPKSELPQCNLGCCVIGDQAALVTEIACNRMAVLYGVSQTFMPNINEELACLASASPESKGACVYTKEFSRTCELTTKKDCNDKKKSSTLANVEFHQGYLCSAPEFQTNCLKTQSTKCEKDDVYFVDSCGNLANIYDANKADDDEYWRTIQEPTCGDGAGNKNSPTCGNCGYLSGSMCRQKEVGETVSFGENICKDLDCKDYRQQYSGGVNGLATAAKYPRHGESWCATDNTGAGTPESPGASFFRLMCYNGEVINEQCDATREKICLQAEDETSKYWTGNCRVNRWRDCWQQKTEDDCADTNLRDCHWEAGYSFSENGIINGGGSCVPDYAPGFDTNGNEQVTGGESCGAANSVCLVKVKRGLLASAFGAKWECDEGLFGLDKEANNCSCLDPSLVNAWGDLSPDKMDGYDNVVGRYTWKEGRNNICNKIGDCGNKVNYIGKSGYPQTDIKVETISE